MNLRREAVRPEDYWEFQPGERVMTIDGYPGKVDLVEDGPISGAENYVVTLDGGMGGGNYSASMLTKMPTSRSAAGIHLATDDYPELGTVLDDRPDPGKMTFTAAKVVPNTARAEADAEDHDEEDPEEIDPSSPGGSDDQPHSCSYCGGTEFKDFADNGRVRQATCATCNGTMSAHPGAQWTPELIGDPSNHPSPAVDPRSGASGAGGVAGINDSIDFDSRVSTTAASRTVSWNEIGDRHPHVYGDSDIHGEDADGADGPGIGDAANYLAHERAEDPDAENSSVHDLDFHPMHVHPRHIDYKPSGSDDPRVQRAREGYQKNPDAVPPLVLVHRHGVYQVADGHHRAEAAHSLDKPVRAYVAHSPHPDEPFRDGEKGPFHGAEPEARKDSRGPWERHLVDEHGEYGGSELDQNPRYTQKRHTQLHPGCDFDSKTGAIGGHDWCTWRREARCTFPGDSSAVSLAIPQDRGPCPWDTAWQQQVCPISEPGPMALMQAKGSIEVPFRVASSETSAALEAHMGKRWYHGSPEELAPGTDLVAGHVSHKPDGDHDHVWISDDPEVAGRYGQVHEVETAHEPVAQGADREYRVPAASVVRHIGNPRDAPVDPKGRSQKVKFHLETNGGYGRVRATHHGRDIGNFGWDDEGNSMGHWVHPDYPRELGDQMVDHARRNGHEPKLSVKTALARLTSQMREKLGSGSANVVPARKVASGDGWVGHRPPGPGQGNPLHDLNDVHGHQNGSAFGINSDVYSHPQHWTGFHDHELDHAVKSAEGRPHAPVTVYRAQPREHQSIRNGDWVTPSAAYAHLHGSDGFDGPVHIVKATVPAQHVWTSADDIVEAGYHGPHIEHAEHHADVED